VYFDIWKAVLPTVLNEKEADSPGRIYLMAPFGQRAHTCIENRLEGRKTVTSKRQNYG
jgi:hypothetical protein